MKNESPHRDQQSDGQGEQSILGATIMGKAHGRRRKRAERNRADANHFSHNGQRGTLAETRLMTASNDRVPTENIHEEDTRPQTEDEPGPMPIDQVRFIPKPDRRRSPRDTTDGPDQKG